MSYSSHSGRDGTKLYVGNLSHSSRERDVYRLFDRYGTVLRCDLKGGFGFVHFKRRDDAEEAIHELDGTEFDGRRLIVEFGRGGGARRGGGGGGGRYGGRGGGGGGRYNGGGGGYGGGGGGGGGGFGGGGGRRGGRGDFRIEIENLSSHTSWQDLKDFAREGGKSVMYTDVWSEDGKYYGIIEYSRRDDYEYALKHLNEQKLDGKYVRLYRAKDRSRSRSRSRDASPRRSSPRSGSRERSRDRSVSSDRSRSRAKSEDRSRSREKSASRSHSRGRDVDMEKNGGYGD